MSTKVLSKQSQLSFAPLESLMYESLQAKWGLKIRVYTSPLRLKSAFYKLRQTDEVFKNLSLITTKEPAVFLLYHPSGESDE